MSPKSHGGDSVNNAIGAVHAGQSPEVKQQIVEMAMNANGIRDTARVLHVSPTAFLKELKKNLSSSK